MEPPNIYAESAHLVADSPVVKWLSLLTLNQASQVRILAGEFLLFVIFVSWNFSSSHASQHMGYVLPYKFYTVWKVIHPSIVRGSTQTGHILTTWHILTCVADDSAPVHFTVRCHHFFKPGAPNFDVPLIPAVPP
jgi:hypothetical protein